ncbi:MAG: tyrosine--tRNA ligase [Thermoanaerobaculales bacterium]|nr:tyrosine--tRNA ligase [Thermoanaerobaculales bacterium]
MLRGTDQVVPPDELVERLGESRPLRVKLGLDPTAPAVTLGWAVVLRKLRQFQELGHKAVLIVGDFTAQVGDPSDRESQRKRLSADEVRGYADSVLDGFKKVLIWDDSVLEVRYNSEWLAKLDMGDVLELTSKVTVAQILERGDFQKRFNDNQPISLMEFMYPLLQGMDSVAVDADIELGGSDQLWNNMMGRVLQERYGKRGQMVMTMPLLVGTDGEHKMSQSLGNYIAVDDDPADMFGKVMSIPDHLIAQYFELATDLPQEDVGAVIEGLDDGSLHPGETKRRLGREIVGLYWGSEAGEEAEAAFDQVFKRGEVPDEVREFVLPNDDQIFLPALLRDAGLVKSSSEARRLISQGAVKMNGETITDETLSRSTLNGVTVQIGKRRFIKLTAEA